MLFEAAPEALIAVSLEGLHVTAANRMALALIGDTRENLSRYSLRDLLAPQDLTKLQALIKQGTTSTAPSTVENCSFRNRSGVVIAADLIVAFEPEAPLLMISIRDATARTNVQEQVRQAQKMEALGMLSGGIAHDFNNLLTIIVGYSQMLLGSSQVAAEKDRTAIEQILKASERAAELTSQLLAFSRRQPVQPKIVEVNRIVDQTVAMLGRLIGEHIELRIQKAADAGRIHADAGQIQQVLMNLAINSRDAMPGGGRLDICTANVELGANGASDGVVAKPGSYVMLEVADTGTGMDSATRARVFEPFFTTKPSGHGTGLGLSTVHGLVRRWGGTITLHSEPGQGSTFRVYLPRVQDEPTEQRPEAVEAHGGHETILLVEDEEGVRRMVHMALERRGYRVLVAASGPEGLEIARSHEGAIDLLITDIVMPQMNGTDFALRLLKDRPATRLLFISGYTGNVFQAGGPQPDEMTFLQKPFAPTNLTDRVRKILDAGQAANGATQS
ncbi:MAG: ATP-binding protein [Terriglobia bacterium]